MAECLLLLSPCISRAWHKIDLHLLWFSTSLFLYGINLLKLSGNILISAAEISSKQNAGTDGQVKKINVIIKLIFYLSWVHVLANNKSLFLVFMLSYHVEETPANTLRKILYSTFLWSFIDSRSLRYAQFRSKQYKQYISYKWSMFFISLKGKQHKLIKSLCKQTRT